MWVFKKKEIETETEKIHPFPEYDISEDEKKELEKVRKNFEKNLMSEMSKVKEKMKVDLIKEIEKTNLNCKEILKEYYEKTGQFPKEFECSFEVPTISNGYYLFDDYNKFKIDDVYEDVQKTDPHNITFKRQARVYFGSETFMGYKVTLNKII